MMWGAPAKLVKVAAILSVAWSTFGMELDLCSGPLSPEIMLNALCGLVYRAPLARASRHLVPPASQKGTGSRDRQQPAPRPRCGANWSSPVPDVSHGNRETKPPTLIASDFSTAIPSARDISGHRNEISQPLPRNLPLQLCRLLC